jgi:hypothetical protein
VLIKLSTPENIRKLILAWEQPTITWEAVRAKVNLKFRSEWTRQALSNHPKILKAFQATKKRLRDERDISPKRRKSLTRDTTVPILQERVRFLEDRVIELERTVEQYQAPFARWQRNAYLAGIPCRNWTALCRKLIAGGRTNDLLVYIFEQGIKKTSVYGGLLSCLHIYPTL